MTHTHDGSLLSDASILAGYCMLPLRHIGVAVELTSKMALLNTLLDVYINKYIGPSSS